MQNLMDAKSMIETVDKKYEIAISILQRMRELALQYQNGTLSTNDKEAIRKELTSNQLELSRVLQNVTFNNQKITLNSIEGKLLLKNKGDYIVIPDNPQIDIAGNGITMEAKITLDGTPDGSWGSDRWTVVSKAGNYYLTIDSNRKVAIYKYGTIPEKYWVSNSQVPIGVETHIVGTFDDTSAKIYINGVLDSSFVLTSSGYRDVDNHLKIGYEKPGLFERQFEGTIDDVRIYNRALTDTEVLNNYQGNVTIDGLVGEWLFNDGGAKVAYDTSGNNNAGYLRGKARITTSGITFDTGDNSLDKHLQVSFSEITLQKLGLNNLTIIDERLIHNLNQAIESLSLERAYAGSLLNKIEFRLQNNLTAETNYAQTNARIKETDIAYSLSNLTKMEIKQSTIFSILNQKIMYDQQKIKLLKG